MLRYCLILFLLHVVFITNCSEKSLHPFYFGWVEIEKKEKKLKIKAKFFVNDLEACLRKKHPTVDLLNDAQEVISKLLNEYFISNFSIVGSGGINAKLNYLGYNILEDMCYLYYSSDIPDRVNSLTIRCTMLFDGIPTQVNIIRFFDEKNTQIFFLNRSEPQKQVNVN